MLSAQIGAVHIGGNNILTYFLKIQTSPTTVHIMGTANERTLNVSASHKADIPPTASNVNGIRTENIIKVEQRSTIMPSYLFVIFILPITNRLSKISHQL